MALVITALALTSCAINHQQFNELRTTTNEYRHIMQLPEYPISKVKYACSTLRKNRWPHTLWWFRYKEARILFIKPPQLASWLCIYRGENGGHGWSANTGNGYYGGLQMDLEFQSTYGSELLHKKGTANRWTKWEQIWTAIRAYRSGRGFSPWPNTAANCGLL